MNDAGENYVQRPAQNDQRSEFFSTSANGALTNDSLITIVMSINQHAIHFGGFYNPTPLSRPQHSAH